MAHDTIPNRLVRRARSRPTEPAYFVKRQGSWQATTWSEYATQVRRAAAALLALGLGPGDGIALLARNGPEWTTLLLGAMSIGVRATGLYVAMPADQTARLLTHADARLVLVDDDARIDALVSGRAALPALTQVVSLTATSDARAPFVRGWSAFLQLGDAQREDAADAHREGLGPDTVAALVYTAGSGDSPRGALLSQRNLTFTADAVRDVLRIEPSDLSLSYLPLAHVAEQLASVYAQVSIGHTVYFPSRRSALEDLREVQPTMVLGAPRLWEKLAASIESSVTGLHEPRAGMVSWARRLASAVVEASSAGKEPPFDRLLQYELARKLVLEPMRRGLGLGRAHICVSGVAPLDARTLACFGSLGIQLLETYGQAETTGVATLNQPRRTRAGTAGPKLPGTTLSLADDGEVRVRGPNVFLGYHRDPEASARVLVDGELRTGDVGARDAEGFLTVHGARRELLQTAGGCSLAPAHLEAALRGEPLIQDAVVLADRRRMPCALIVVDETFAHDLGLAGDLHENEIVRERVDDQVRRVNQALHPSTRIRHFLLLPRRLSVAEGELTAGLKPRRQRLEEQYAELLTERESDTPDPSEQRAR